MNACGGCDPCENACKDTCCNNACLRWGFDGCYLRGRCADGTELTPLDLCAWLKVHETCTELLLVPDTSHGEQDGGYMLYKNECGEEYKFWVCDFLNLASIRCLKDVYDYDDYDPEDPDNPNAVRPCDLFVFSPDCDGDPDNPTYNKWTPYHIPDAGDCIIQPDEDGYSKVLVKDECGCIKECKLFVQPNTWEYALRDSWPDDPDWPFTVGSFDEVIDLKLDEKIDMFGKTDLEVTFQYGYGIQAQGQRSSWVLDAREFHNFQSRIVPLDNATPTAEPAPYESIPVSTSDVYSKAIVVQGNNLLPWGSWEWQVSRTVIVPKGQKLYLHHRVREYDHMGNVVPLGTSGQAPGADCSRLHALHVLVRATKWRKV